MKDFVRVLETQTAERTRPECPLNSEPMHPVLTVPIDWRRPSDRRPWQIWWNDSAAFGQVHPRPAVDEVASFYDLEDYYTHAERVEHDSDAERRQVGILGRAIGSLASHFERGAEPTADWWQSIIPAGAQNSLEIGCGDGDRMQTYQPFLAQGVRGVEPDPRAVRVARERGLDVHQGTAEDLPDAIKDRRYDLIAFVHVLEHTLDPVLSLKNAGALLADGGIMSVEVPNNACEGARMMGEAWRWLDVPRHLNFFTPDSLAACAEAAGLTVRAVLFRGYVRQFMPDWLVDEARIGAELKGRKAGQADIDRQVRHSARLFARTALAKPAQKYDSVRILCSRA